MGLPLVAGSSACQVTTSGNPLEGLPLVAGWSDCQVATSGNPCSEGSREARQRARAGARPHRRVRLDTRYAPVIGGLPPNRGQAHFLYPSNGGVKACG